MSPRSLPVEVPWSDAASPKICLFCETLADRPGQGLNRKARLNSARDGWVIIDFECPSCGWTASLTCFIDDQGVKPPSVSLARAEEVEQPEDRRAEIDRPARESDVESQPRR